MSESCKSCRFFEHGSCLRYPPVVLARPDHNILSMWPDVDVESWCGEHVPRETAPRSFAVVMPEQPETE